MKFEDLKYVEDVKFQLTPLPSPTKPLQMKVKPVAIPAPLPPIPNNLLPILIKQEVGFSFFSSFFLFPFLFLSTFPVLFNLVLNSQIAEPQSKKRKIEPAGVPIQMKPTPAAPVPLSTLSRGVSVSLAPQEIPETARKQQRLMKNREAALMSRQRRKDYMKQLEGRVTVLSKENDELKKKIESLESKNSDLVQRLSLGGKTGIKAGVVIMVSFFFLFFFFFCFVFCAAFLFQFQLLSGGLLLFRCIFESHVWWEKRHDTTFWVFLPLFSLLRCFFGV